MKLTLLFKSKNNQTDLFAPVEGTEKEFAPGDKRRLQMTPSGKMRYVNADQQNVVYKNDKFDVGTGRIPGDYSITNIVKEGEEPPAKKSTPPEIKQESGSTNKPESDNIGKNEKPNEQKFSDWSTPEAQDYISKNESRIGEKEALTPIMKDTYGIPGENGNQEWSAVLAPSTKEPGKWQITQMSLVDGQPFSDHIYDTKAEALKEFRNDIPRRPDVISSIEKMVLDEGKTKLETKYELTSRPPSIGTHPTKGFIGYEEGGKRHGYVKYDRMLSNEELKKYELKPIGREVINIEKPKSDISTEKPIEKQKSGLTPPEKAGEKAIEYDKNDYKSLLARHQEDLANGKKSISFFQTELDHLKESAIEYKKAGQEPDANFLAQIKALEDVIKSPDKIGEVANVKANGMFAEYYDKDGNLLRRTKIGNDGEARETADRENSLIERQKKIKNYETEAKKLNDKELKTALDRATVTSNEDAIPVLKKEMDSRKSPDLGEGKGSETKKSLFSNLFKALGTQEEMFNQQHKEGETKEGKGGTLVLKRSKTGKGSRWQFANKKQPEPGIQQDPRDANQPQGGTQTLTAAKAYDELSDKLGNKATATDPTGQVMGEGTFQLINENSDGSTSIFIKDNKGESQIINLPANQTIIKNADNIEIPFKDRKISISLTEPGEKDTDGEDPFDPDEQQTEAKKMQEWNRIADSYIQEANGQKEVWLQDIDSVAIENDLVPMSHEKASHTVKSKESIINKFERQEAKGNFTKKVTDMLRGTLIVNNPNQMNDIIKGMEERDYKIWNNDIVNMYEDKTPGFKHIAIKFVKHDQDEVIKELILMMPKMYEAKNGFGHDLYKVERNIDIELGKKIQEKNPLAKELQNFKDTIKELTNRFYARAYKADLSDKSAAASKAPPEAQESNNALSSSVGYSVPPKALIRSLRSSLKAIWQPLLASSMNSSGAMLSPGASSPAIDKTLSSIVKPTENIIKKYASSILDLFKGKKIEVNIQGDKKDNFKLKLR